MTPLQYVKIERKITGKPAFLSEKVEKAFLEVFGEQCKELYRKTPICDRWCTNRVHIEFKVSRPLMQQVSLHLYYDAGAITAIFTDLVAPAKQGSFQISAGKSQKAYTGFFRRLLEFFVEQVNISESIDKMQELADRI